MVRPDDETGAREPGPFRRALRRWSARDFARAILVMAVGAVAMIGLGKLYGSFVGGTCTALCRPHVSGPYGAAAGLLVYIFQKFD
ncbi:MAG TPA: hypothetical protein VN033_08755 [Vulgatibacter sp.]|nr:hypothetical protein [Vulgatibacter sp.]